MPVRLTSSTSGDSIKQVLVVVLILTAATAGAHGWALWDGLFLDDHLHKINFSNDDWSFRWLLESTTIAPERFMHTWWQDQKVEWHYTRPFSVLLAKTIYHLTAQSVKAMHWASIILHLLNSLMIYRLCRLLTGRRFWSVVGGLLLVVYSHSIFAVGWLAAQNGVLQTTLTLASLLCYMRGSGLNLCPYNKNDGDSSVSDTVPRLNMFWFLSAVFLWCLAVLSRENAVVLPVFLLAFDFAFGGRRYLGARWKGYLLLAGIAVAFILWRFFYFHHPMPEFYVRRPDGAGYVLWCVAKLMHYLTSVIWLSPMVIGPTARYSPFSEVPGDCLLMFVILAVLGTMYYLFCRRARGWWLWPLWIFLSILPVVPVMATPHSGYFSGVGFAVGMILGPALRDRIKPDWIGRLSPAVALWFLIATTVYMPIYRTLWRSFLAAERYTVEQIAAYPPPGEATDLFFINLPFVNIYIQKHLQEVMADRDSEFECHVLTYAPNVLRMEGDCIVEQLDGYSFSVSTTSPPYFSGALGRFLIEGMRPGGRLLRGDVVEGELFDVIVVGAGADGVDEMVFRFQEPLSSSRYCFYVTTAEFAAARLKFAADPGRVPQDSVGEREPIAGMAEVAEAAGRLEAGEAQAAETLFIGMDSGDAGVSSAAREAFFRVARPVAAALAAPIGDILYVPEWSSSERARVRGWWRNCVDDRALDALWVHGDDLVWLGDARDKLFGIRKITAKIIESDLYLTGPPYPGPR
ncbi:MAG: glycosyltransferase family protein [Planctomycetota bacterium]